MTKKKIQAEVKKITELIIKKYQPEKIILFGSAVSGKFHPDSDIDLLVIKKTREPYWERQIKVTEMYEGWFPTDIFVLTPAEFVKAKRENRFFLTEEILPKGEVIYEKSH